MNSGRPPGKYALGIIGVGNTLAGDDGAGNIVVNRLREKYSDRSDIFLHNLETDPLELWDLLPVSRRFIFVDAVAGEPPGKLIAVGKKGIRRAFAPSLHQMDLPTVIEQLCRLRQFDEVQWCIWGVTIDIPEFLREELSEEVSAAVDYITGVLSERIESEDYRIEAPVTFEQFAN